KQSHLLAKPIRKIWPSRKRKRKKNPPPQRLHPSLARIDKLRPTRRHPIKRQKKRRWNQSTKATSELSRARFTARTMKVTPIRNIRRTSGRFLRHITPTRNYNQSE